MEQENSKLIKKRWNEEEGKALGFLVLRYLDQGYNDSEACNLASTHMPERTADACRTYWSSNLKDTFLKVKEYSEILMIESTIAPAPTTITVASVHQFLDEQQNKIALLELENASLSERYDSLLEVHDTQKSDLDMFRRAISKATEFENLT